MQTTKPHTTTKLQKLFLTLIIALFANITSLQAASQNSHNQSNVSDENHTTSRSEASQNSFSSETNINVNSEVSSPQPSSNSSFVPSAAPSPAPSYRIPVIRKKPTKIDLPYDFEVHIGTNNP